MNEEYRYWLHRGRTYHRDFVESRQQLHQYRYQERRFSRLVSRLRFRSVIEIGCGFGRVSRLLPRRATRYALDISPDQLRAASAYLGGAADLICASAECLPFRDDSVDLALAVEVLMHLPPDVMLRVLREMARVARRYVANLDWYEPSPVRTARGHDWSHDYLLAYESLGLPLKRSYPFPGCRQRMFIAEVGSG